MMMIPTDRAQDPGERKISGAGDVPHPILIERTKRLLAERSVVARSWWDRMVGLLNRASLPPGEALVFPDCRSIHTIGMRFSIDVIFVNRHWRVAAVHAAVPPGRFVLSAWNAWAVIEMASGTLDRAELQVGDQLRVT